MIYPFSSPIYLFLGKTIIQLHPYPYLLPYICKLSDRTSGMTWLPFCCKQSTGFQGLGLRESLIQFASCVNERNSTLTSLFKFSQQLKQEQNPYPGFPSVDLMCFQHGFVVCIFYLLVQNVDGNGWWQVETLGQHDSLSLPELLLSFNYIC